jgi:hypothetical protein
MMAEVHVVGMVRGREIAGAARFSVEAQYVQLAWLNAAPWQVSFDGIDGAQVGATSITLYLRDHDVLELTGDDALRPAGLKLLDAVCRMPELTRGLRSLGAVRGTDALQATHDRWFAPLLAARRAVADVSDPTRQAALLDGRALLRDLERAISEIAATRAPGSPAEQRALEAAMEDEAEPLFAALTRMAVAGDVVRAGAEDTRFADWRRWVDVARRVFAESDDAWVGIADVLNP